jgi:hypothetical protein
VTYYWLKLLESWKIHNVFHATLLQPYIKNKVYGNNYPRPLPELLEGKEVHEVESSDIREEEEVINIMWNGKVIPLLRQHENTLQPSRQMEICWRNIKNDTNYRSPLDDYKEDKEKNKTQREYEEVLILSKEYYSNTFKLKMSTSASAQTILTIVKDNFTEVLTEGTLSPTAKQADWNVIITEKALLNAMRTLSPLPEETWCGLATLYDNTFPTAKEYCEFTVNRLVMWGNTLDYKLFDILYMTHQHNSRTVKKLCEQAMTLLEEAIKLITGTYLFDKKLRVMFRLSLDLIFDNRSKSHNEFKSWSPLLPFLNHLINWTILIELPMDATILGDNINASSVATLPISNGITLFTPVELVTGLHLDMHPKHVEDEFMMMESMDITT